MKHLLLIVIVALSLTSCNKKPNSSVISSSPGYMWSTFIGTYDVYDTINNTQWVMKITHLSHLDNNGGNSDSILIENFNNLFTIRDTWSPGRDVSTGLPIFRLKQFDPIKDKFNYRWYLCGNGDDPNTPRIENIFKGDTIVLNFQQSNISYYLQDGTPYYSCNACKNIAVKRH